KIIAGDGAGTEALLDRSQSSQGDHLAARVPRLEFEDIILSHAELAVRLSGHLKRATEIGEVVHIGRAEIDLKCVKNIGQRDVHAWPSRDPRPRTSAVGRRESLNRDRLNLAAGRPRQ